MKKSIVLLTKNSPKNLYDCTDNLFRNLIPPYELVIVDNSNLPDQDQESVIKTINNVTIKNVVVKIIRNGKNLGSSRGRNIGLNEATADFITFIDDDARIMDKIDHGVDLIDHFISILLKNSRIGAVGPCCAVTPKLNFIAVTTALMTIPEKIKMYGYRFDERMGHHFDRETLENKPNTCGYEDIDFSYMLHRSGYMLVNEGWDGNVLPFYHPMPSDHSDWEFRKKLADENTARIFDEKWKADLEFWKKYNEDKEDAQIEEELYSAVSSHPNEEFFKVKKYYTFSPEQSKIDNDKSKVKINLGSGEKNIPGWINVDLFDEKADLQCNVNKLESINDNSVDMMLASHVIEHFSIEEIIPILAEWRRVLKPDGILIVEFPDFIKCSKFFISNSNILMERMNVTPQILGAPFRPGHSHYSLLDFNFMKYMLERGGFKNVVENADTPTGNIRHLVTRIDCKKI